MVPLKCVLDFKIEYATEGWIILSKETKPFLSLGLQCWYTGFKALIQFYEKISPFLRLCCCSVAKSCLPLCDPMSYSLPGSSFHGIFQARILEWIAISFSRGSSQPRDQTQGSNPGLPHCRHILYHLSREALCFTVGQKVILLLTHLWTLPTLNMNAWIFPSEGRVPKNTKKR